MKKIIIIGASSGIGKELTKIFASHGYEVGIAARRSDLLNEIAAEMPTKTYTTTIDSAPSEAGANRLETPARSKVSRQTVIELRG